MIFKSFERKRGCWASENGIEVDGLSYDGRRKKKEEEEENESSAVSA